MAHGEQPRDGSGRFAPHRLVGDDLSDALAGLRRAFDETAPHDEIDQASKALVDALRRMPARLIRAERGALADLLGNPSMELVSTDRWNVIRVYAEAQPISEDGVRAERQAANDQRLRASDKHRRRKPGARR